MENRRRTTSPRMRILAAILVIAAIGLVVAGGVMFVVQRERAVADVDRQLAAEVHALVDRSTPPSPSPSATTATGSEITTVGVSTLAPGDYATTRQYLRAAFTKLPTGPREAAAGILDGKAVIRSASSDVDVATDDSLIAHIVTETTRAGGVAVGTADTSAGPVRFIAVPVSVPGDSSSGIYVRAIDLSEEFAPATAAVLAYAIIAVLTLAAIALVSWIVLGRVLVSPMKSLQQTAEAVTLSDLHQRVPTEGNDDIGDVGRTVNEMLDRLEGSVDVQRRLLDDVRHELKTPITIVRGHLEMMNIDDRADVLSTREIGISELDRMTRLVEDIDLLAAVEDDEYTMGLVDIGRLTTRVGELVVVIPGHQWRVLDRAPVVVRGNSDRLLQAWLALAENAAKYTPEGTPIELGSTIVGGAVHLWLRDHGPGIPASSRHRIFRRFDRGGGRRDVGGSGLGLAIVDAITRAHGGSCIVTDTPGGGATFVIRIPVKVGSSTSVFPAPVRAEDLIQQWEETA